MYIKIMMGFQKLCKCPNLQFHLRIVVVFLQAVVVWLVVFYFASLSPSASFISGLSLG